MSSRLFQEVREKRGLCYSIYAFTNNFQDGGFTGIYVGTGEDEAVKLVRDRLGIKPYDFMEDAVKAAIEATR